MPSQPTLRINRRDLGRTLVLTLEGVADSSSVDWLEGELREAAATRPQHVLVDLTHLQSIAALVNGELAVFANTIRHNGGDVRYLMRPNRRVA